MSAPFIGSRISLISKSDVRYEGILCGIDTNESKVYLQHVRCFGTEDRRKENPIAASTDVYEVIIFHSSDIKDLSVCELPPPVAYDPMSFNSFTPMGSGYPPQYGYPPMVHPQYGPQYGFPYGPYGHNYGMYPQSPSMMGPQENAGPFPGEQGNDKPLSVQPPQKINVTTTKVETAQPQSQPSETPVDNHKEPTHEAQPLTVDSNDNAKAEVTSEESHSQKSNNYHNKNQNNNHNKRNNNRNNNFVYLPKGDAQRNNQAEKSNENTQNNSQQSDSPVHSDQQNNRQNNHNNQSDYRQKRGNSNNRGYKGHYNNNNRRGFDSRGHHNTSDQSHFHKPKEQNEPKSQEDFDFLISNSKFEKLSIAALPGELEKELPKISPSYNKDSFYDNISCDTLDREDSKDKKSYYEQRKLDSETFGDIGRRNNNNRGRTRGRYDTHSQNNHQNNYSGNSNNNQKRYNNNYNNRGNRNYRGNKNASGNNSNSSDNTAQN